MLSTPALSVTGEPTETVTEAPTEATEVPTETVTEAPTETVTDAPTAGPTAAGSFLTGGYSTPELAINQFVVDQGFTFDGDCATAEGTGYCSAAGDKVGNGVIYGVGLVGSDPEVWMLMRQVNGKWYVVDVAAATSSPPWS